MTKEMLFNELMNYFDDNEEVFIETIEELDNYNGFLGDDRYYFMEDLDEIYNGVEPTEILRRAFYGYNGDYTDKDGNHPEPFNPNAEYFSYNGYGNLVSSNYKDYSALLDEYFLQELLDNWTSLYINEELTALFEEYENGTEATA